MGHKFEHILLTFAAMIVIPFILAYGCSLEEPENRKIRAHTVNNEGVPHGARAELAPRYCQECHGLNLEGGEAGEPSCFQCHGINWQKIDRKTSRAPEDHKVDHGGFIHHPNLNSPESVCTNCHGAELQGDESQNTASCYLCHDNLWD